MLRVHFTGWSYKYDEWIDERSDRVLKQWRRGMPFRINNRIDVKDVKGKWLEARIIHIVPDQYMTVHFKGWSSKWDEQIPIHPEHLNDLIDTKFAEIGMYSDAFGKAKFDKQIQQSQLNKLNHANHED